MSDLNTEFEYNKEITDLAESIVETAYNQYDEVTDRESAEELINDTLLHETIDGHQWVIYYAYNLGVIQYSKNDSYMVDNFGGEAVESAVKEGGMSGLHTAVAFWCMYADVQEELESALDKYEEEHEEEEE